MSHRVLQMEFSLEKIAKKSMKLGFNMINGRLINSIKEKCYSYRCEIYNKNLESDMIKDVHQQLSKDFHQYQGNMNALQEKEARNQK